MNMNNYCYTNYLHGVWVTVIDFLIAKQFEMKEEVSFKMGYDLLFNKIFILFSALLKKIKFSVFDTLS
jgi:hypothetical protein